MEFAVSQNKNVTVVDSIMGSGKTTWAIKKMQEDKDHNFVYITPYLDEVQRIKTNVKNRQFYEPMHLGVGKQANFHKLLSQEKDIASTHALFRLSDSTTKELIRTGNYILILDEVMDVVEKMDITPKDVQMLLENTIELNDKGFIVWKDKEYTGRFSEFRTAVEEGNVILVNDTVLIWNFPVSVFESFKEIYILTYLFDAQIQRYYYDMFNVKYDYKSTNGDVLMDYTNSRDFRGKMNIIDNSKINSIGDNDYTLSSTWYDKEENKELIMKMKRNLHNYFNNVMKSGAKYNMWTCFKRNKVTLRGKGYLKGFVSVNARATNEFREKNTLAYCVNLFLNPLIKNYFIQYGIRVEEDKYALSELLQWTWRSAIRDGEDITIYIPSKRMRDLLVNWAEGKD